MKACYSSVQNFLLFLLSKRIKIKFTEQKFFLSFDVKFKPGLSFLSRYA